MERDRWLSVVLRTALILLFFWMVQSLLVPIALGAIFALLLYPLLDRAQENLGRAKRFAPLLITFGTLVLVVIPLVLITIESVRSINEFLTRDWSPIIQRVQAFFKDGVDIRGRSIHIGGAELQAALQNLGERAASAAAAALGGMAAALPSFLLALFLFAVSLYYFLRDGDSIVDRMYGLSPFPSEQTHELLGSVRGTVNGAILGLLATAFVQGGLTLIALNILGVPNAFLLGMLAALLSFVPLVGTTPVTLGCAIYLFVIGRVGAGVGMLAAAVLIGLSDNVVRPWVQSTSTRMHPLVVLLGIFGGLQFFGAVGVFLGPVVAAMAVWTMETYAKLHPPPKTMPPTEG